MADDAKEKDRLRAQLTDMLRRVPDSVNNGGIETVRTFKKFHGSAMKIIQSQRTSMQQLTSTFTQASGYYNK